MISSHCSGQIHCDVDVNKRAVYERLIEKAKANPIGFVQRHYRLMLALTALLGLVASLLCSVVISAGLKLALDGQAAFGQNDLETFEISHFILFFWVILWIFALLMVARLHEGFRSWRRRKGEGLDDHFEKALELIDKWEGELPNEAQAIVVDTNRKSGKPSLIALLLVGWGSLWAFFFLPLSSMSMGWMGVWTSHLALLLLILSFELDERVHPLFLLLIPPMLLSWAIIAFSFYPTALIALLPILYFAFTTIHSLYCQRRQSESPSLLVKTEHSLYLQSGNEWQWVKNIGPIFIKAEGYASQFEFRDGEKTKFTFRCRQELEAVFGTELNLSRPLVNKGQRASLAAAAFVFISAFIAPSSFIATATVENLIYQWDEESKPSVAQSQRMCLIFPISPASHALMALATAENGNFAGAVNAMERFIWLRGEQVPALYGLKKLQNSGCLSFCRQASELMKTEQEQFHKAHQLIRLADVDGHRLPSRLTINKLVQEMLKDDDDIASKQLMAICLSRTVWRTANQPTLPEATMKEWTQRAIALMEDIGVTGAEKGYAYFRNEMFKESLDYLAQSPEERELLLRASAMRFTHSDLTRALALLEKCKDSEDKQMLSALIHSQMGNYVLATSILQNLKGNPPRLIELLIAHQNGRTLPRHKVNEWPHSFPLWLADVDLEYLHELRPQEIANREAKNLRIFVNQSATHDKKRKRGFSRLATLKWYPYSNRAKLQTKLRLEGER